MLLSTVGMGPAGKGTEMGRLNYREELIEALAQVDMADEVYLEILRKHPEAEEAARAFIEAFDLEASRDLARKFLDGIDSLPWDDAAIAGIFG